MATLPRDVPNCSFPDSATLAAVLPNATPVPSIPGLALALLQAGRLSAPQAESLQKKAANDKLAFIDVLLASGAIDARALAMFCSETFAYPLMDLQLFNLEL